MGKAAHELKVKERFRANAIDELVLGFKGAKRSTFGIYSESRAKIAASPTCNLSYSRTDDQHASPIPMGCDEELIDLPQAFSGVTFQGNPGFILGVEKHRARERR
ncbi:uncharacterized protein EHS24_003156 [Apiotrichum porosum]|uniref:Uncharacterized protein n=1 Tax=Apiotrichum porosum TaxID=105984 RepID=A0A427XFJ2_9TREE|nr:uncharacterized protein EHS24_003156 [Apiotrichum porosum]RSH77596.1 hypothetical protein EHS24_003156 [Apiotrichum porosum]